MDALLGLIPVLLELAVNTVTITHPSPNVRPATVQVCPQGQARSAAGQCLASETTVSSPKAESAQAMESDRDDASR